MKQKRLVALLLVLAMLVAIVTVAAACDKHECKHVCETCGKCTDATCTDPACKDKCPGHETAHVCGHVCKTCGKCTDATCTDPACAEKCQGHVQKQPLAAGNYNIVLRDETNSLVWYATGAIGSKGGLLVSHSDTTVAVLTVIYENDKYTLKIGSQYLEAYLNGTYKNMRLVNTPSNDAIEWKWSTEYDTFCATYSDETRYLGGNYYNGQVDNLYDGAVTLATAYYFQNNPVVIHYEEVEEAAVESIELDRAGEVPMLPIAGNTISLVASVKPNNAPQDVEWTSSDQEVATVQNGTVTFAGKKGTTTITATAKGTDKTVSVTINTDIKGDTIENALTVDEAIELMDRVYASMAAVMDKVSDTFAYGGGDDYNFYVKGTVMEGSQTRNNGTEWVLYLAGSDGKKLWVTSVPTISSITKNEDGWLDGCEVVVYITFNKQPTAYVAQRPCEMKSCEFPALTDIVITEAEEGVELKAKYTVQLHATPVPANAPFEGLEWISSDNTKATVDEKGLVTGVAAGDVEITAKVGEVISSVACVVTVTEPQVSVNKIVYDWTGKLAGKVVNSVYNLPKTGDIMSLLQQWSPDNEEITSFTVTGMRTAVSAVMGMGLAYGTNTDSSMVIGTKDNIKAIVFKIIPFSTASITQISVNGVDFKKEKSDGDIWDGKIESMFEARIELTEASNTLNVTIPSHGTDDYFAIVGMTLEVAAPSQIFLDWTGKLAGKVVNSVYNLPKTGDIMSLLQQWSPDNEEITSFTVTGMRTAVSAVMGMGLAYGTNTDSSMVIGTKDNIKAIVFKIIPFSTASITQISVNGVDFKKEKSDGDIWDGKIESMFEARIELTEASNTLNVTIPSHGTDDYFAIVGMTLEW